MSASADEKGEVKEYLIDGNTAVDDLLFAKLHADMDSRVQGYLDSEAGACPAGRIVDPEKFREALRRANEVLELSLRQTQEDGLEALSTSSSSAGSDSDEDEPNNDDHRVEKSVEIDEADFIEEGEMLEGVDEFKADKILELPPEMTPSGIPDSVDEDDILILVGTFVAEVEDMLTVKAAVCGNSSVWELGSLCCLADRTIIGYVIDTMGPTHAPFYVVKKIRSFQAQPDTEIYTTPNSAIARLNDS